MSIAEEDFWPGLKELLADLSGAGIVQDANETREHQPADVVALYVDIIARRTIGQTPSSSYAEAVEDDDGPVFETLSTIENLTIRVDVKSLDQTPGYKADKTATRLKLGLYFETSYARLQALSLGMGACLFDSRQEDTADDHYASVVRLDFRMMHTSSLTDPTEQERIAPEASEDIEGQGVQLWENLP